MFVALLALIQAELCDAESDAADRPVLDRATSYLKAKGKGDCYFTQQQYEVLFLKETPGGELDRPKTAAELLGNDDEEGDDDRPARRRK